MLLVTTLGCHFYSNGLTAGNTAEAPSEAEEPRTLIPTPETSPGSVPTLQTGLYRHFGQVL